MKEILKLPFLWLQSGMFGLEERERGDKEEGEGVVWEREGETKKPKNFKTWNYHFEVNECFVRPNSNGDSWPTDVSISRELGWFENRARVFEPKNELWTNMFCIVLSLNWRSLFFKLIAPVKLGHAKHQINKSFQANLCKSSLQSEIGIFREDYTV